jgi:hypothetical protein
MLNNSKVNKMQAKNVVVTTPKYTYLLQQTTVTAINNIDKSVLFVNTHLTRKDARRTLTVIKQTLRKLQVNSNTINLLVA